MTFQWDLSSSHTCPQLDRQLENVLPASLSQATCQLLTLARARESQATRVPAPTGLCRALAFNLLQQTTHQASQRSIPTNKNSF